MLEINNNIFSRKQPASSLAKNLRDHHDDVAAIAAMPKINILKLLFTFMDFVLSMLV